MVFFRSLFSPGDNAPSCPINPYVFRDFDDSRTSRAFPIRSHGSASGGPRTKVLGLAENRGKGRFLLHEFVIMPNHLHLLLTPATEIALEKALQFIKGGFSYRAKREINFPLEIWQASFVNHRIRDAEDYKHHHTYIWENPVRAGLSERPELFAWSSASLRVELDAPPPGLKP
jgi:putative transposase